MPAQSSLYICEESEDIMALNDQDRAWIRETIQNAHKAHGLGVLMRFIKEWSGTGAAIAVILFALTQWTTYVEFRTTTNNRLDAIEKEGPKIEGRLSNIEGQLIRLNLENYASLAPDKFKSTLPDLSSSLKDAKKQGVSVSTGVLDDLQQKLIAAPEDSSGYWPAVAELVSYRSKASNGLLLARDNLPNCVDSKPHSYAYSTNGLGQVDKFYNAYYEH